MSVSPLPPSRVSSSFGLNILRSPNKYGGKRPLRYRWTNLSEKIRKTKRRFHEECSRHWSKLGVGSYPFSFLIHSGKMLILCLGSSLVHGTGSGVSTLHTFRPNPRNTVSLSSKGTRSLLLKGREMGFPPVKSHATTFNSFYEFLCRPERRRCVLES